MQPTKIEATQSDAQSIQLPPFQKHNHGEPPAQLSPILLSQAYSRVPKQCPPALSITAKAGPPAPAKPKM